MIEIIHNLLDKYNIDNTKEQCQDMIDFVENMLKYNEIHNLTSIIDPNEIIFKHILDSVLPIGLFGSEQKILDIGCGAGFPSLPLAILNRSLHITAIDSVRKKTNFVSLIKEQLNLNNLTVIHTRIEDFANSTDYREKFDIVVSRAVAPLNIIIEYSAPMLKNGGYIYAYKGINYQEEINIATNALKVLDCTIEGVEEYNVEEMETNRYLLKIRKNSTISSKYPRKQNKPRTNPL